MGGSSSKENFSDMLNKLLVMNIDSNQHDFWDELWKTILPVQDLFDIVSPETIRKLIIEHPENIKIIITQAIAQLYQVVETPYPIYFEQALNCSRILTRFLPFLLEKTESKEIKDLLWSKRMISKPISLEKDMQQELEPLAVVLINTIFHLLFLPDFTIEDPNIEFTESDVNTNEFKTALMWAPGVGSIEKSIVHSSQYDINRIDILRLLIATFSDSLYQSAEQYDSCGSLFLEVATAVDAPYAEILFYSLMNTSLGYDPIGWGLPYGNLLATDTAKIVMESSIHALIILLDYGYPISLTDVEAISEESLPSVYVYDTEAQGFNIFRRLLGSIETPDQLNFIYKGFVRLLNNTYQAEKTYLPYSITRVTIEQELLILFWKCLEEIPAFMPYILKSCDITQVLVPICYFMLEGRKDISKVGLMYLCTFTLLKLSGERNFSVALNKPYHLQLPVDIPLFTGSYADLLIIVLHKLVVSGTEKLSALYSCFLTIICNISPYCKSLGTVASIKMINLLQLFTSPKFLYASESNHVYVCMLLESLNNIIQYQYEGNGQLIYSILRRKEIFESIANLTLPAALQEAKEIRNKIMNKSQINFKNNTQKIDHMITFNDSNNNIESKIDDNDNDDENIEEPCVDAIPTELVSTKASIPDNNYTTNNNNNNNNNNNTNYNSINSIKNMNFNNQFIPTEEWLLAVKTDMPLNTILRLLKYLIPQIDEITGKNINIDEKQVVEFLKTTTMVGLLPVPHPIIIRKYQANKFTSLWFTAFQWGVIFMHNHQNISLFDGKYVKLFIVQTIS